MKQHVTTTWLHRLDAVPVTQTTVQSTNRPCGLQ